MRKMEPHQDLRSSLADDPPIQEPSPPRWLNTDDMGTTVNLRKAESAKVQKTSFGRGSRFAGRKRSRSRSPPRIQAHER